MSKNTHCYLGLLTYLIFIGLMAYFVTAWVLVFLFFINEYTCNNKSTLED